MVNYSQITKNILFDVCFTKLYYLRKSGNVNDTEGQLSKCSEATILGTGIVPVYVLEVKQRWKQRTTTRTERRKEG